MQTLQNASKQHPPGKEPITSESGIDVQHRQETKTPCKVVFVAELGTPLTLFRLPTICPTAPLELRSFGLADFQIARIKNRLVNENRTLYRGLSITMK
jgi:hypothetical protein